MNLTRVLQLCLGGSLLLVLLFTLGFPFDHNEHMYLSAGALVGEHSLYTGIGYVQMPFLPWLYHAAFSMFWFLPPLLVARLLTFMAFVIAVSGVVYAVREWSKSTWVPYAAGLLLVFSKIFQYAGREADADMWALACVSVAIAFASRCFARQPKPLYLFGIGAALSAAVFFRLYYAPLLAVAVLVVCIASGTRLRNVGSVLAGAVLASLPAVLAYGPVWKTWWLMVYEYHILNGIQASVGKVVILQKITVFYETFSNITNLAGVVLLLLAAAWLFTAGKREGLCSRRLYFARCLVMAFLVAVASALIPTPVVPTYFAHAILLAVVVGSIAASTLEQFDQYICKVLFIGVLIPTVLFGSHQLVLGVLRWSSPEFLAVRYVPNDQDRLLEVLPAGASIATLSPGFLVGSSVEIVPEFATGPFWYRVGDRLPVDVRDELPIATPGSIEQVFARRMPTAIMVGCEGELDNALRAYITAHKYQELPGVFFGCATLYRSPAP